MNSLNLELVTAEVAASWPAEPLAKLVVLLKPLHPLLGTTIPLPQQMSSQAAGFDLAAAWPLTEPLAAELPAVLLAPGERVLIPCGFALEIPPGYEGQIRPRSGLALKHGLTVLNAPGTIDADYRGELKVLLINLGTETVLLKTGERIAQLVFAPVVKVQLQLTLELQVTNRGSGGYGSTGS